MAADTPHARLAELAAQCENTDIGDGVMETPRAQARQIAADLRAVLGAAENAPASGDDDRVTREVAWNIVRSALAKIAIRAESGLSWNARTEADGVVDQLSLLVPVPHAHRPILLRLADLAESIRSDIHRATVADPPCLPILGTRAQDIAHGLNTLGAGSVVAGDETSDVADAISSLGSTQGGDPR